MIDDRQLDLEFGHHFACYLWTYGVVAIVELPITDVVQKCRELYDVEARALGTSYMTRRSLHTFDMEPVVRSLGWHHCPDALLDGGDGFFVSH
jgi:hypothetical protein